MPIAEIEGTTLHYRIEGEGTPCLVMHGGLGLDHHYLAPHLAPLSDTFQLIFYDHRGNGRSGRPPRETITHAQLAADADALAEHLGLDRVAVLGHSYGGFVALELALRRPERVSHLVLVDTAATGPHRDEMLANARRKGATEAMLQALTQGYETVDEFGRWLRLMAPMYFHRFDPDVAEALLAGTVLSTDGFAAPGETARYDVTDRLGEIRVPTLVLVGDDDFILPPARSRVLHEGIPNAELTVFEACGHHPYVEAADAFQARVRAWFGGTAGAPAGPAGGPS